MLSSPVIPVLIGTNFDFPAWTTNTPSSSLAFGPALFEAPSFSRMTSACNGTDNTSFLSAVVMAADTDRPGLSPGGGESSLILTSKSIASLLDPDAAF